MSESKKLPYSEQHKLLTNFPYLRKIWKKNTEEERLLGVSLTGIMDNIMMSGQTLLHREKLPSILESLRMTAVETNIEC